jgi:hypothetical protein
MVFQNITLPGRISVHIMLISFPFRFILGLKKINYFSILPRKFELFRILSNFDVGQGVRAIVLNPTFNTFNNS